jgi:hypothetical protein
MIELTQLSRELNKTGKEKLRKYIDSLNRQEDEEENLFQRLGISNPDGEEPKIQEELEFTDSDYSLVERVSFVEVSEVEAIFEHAEGSKVFTKSGLEFVVKEDARYIHKEILEYKNL